MLQGKAPYHPLSLREVESWLRQWNMPVIGHAGVRVIYDYLDKRLRDTRPLEETLRLELRYAQREPYLHVVARRPE